MDDIQTYSDLIMLFCRVIGFSLLAGSVIGVLIMGPFYRDEWFLARHRPSLRRRIKHDAIKTTIGIIAMFSVGLWVFAYSF